MSDRGRFGDRTAMSHVVRRRGGGMNNLLAPSEIPFGNVLFVTDFSSSSELALPYAVALAEQYHGKVYIAHVIAPEMFEFLPAVLVPDIVERIKSHAQKRMDELVRNTSFYG